MPLNPEQSSGDDNDGHTDSSIHQQRLTSPKASDTSAEANIARMKARRQLNQGLGSVPIAEARITSVPQPETAQVQRPETEVDSEVDKKPSGLDAIGGYAAAKEAVREVIAAINNPAAFREWGVKPPKGVLFFGPPGTGKTMFANAIAQEINGIFVSIEPSDINDKYFGESEKRIKELFERARENSGLHTVIFIDEIESILGRRDKQWSGGVKDSIMTMFLQYMDGKDSPDNVTIIGATNRPEAIDDAILRPGRFDKQIEIGFPDIHARKEILRIHISSKEEVAGRVLFDLEEAGLETLLVGIDNLTGAQIAEAVKRACLAKAHKQLSSDMRVGLITVDDLAGGFASLLSESARYDT